MSKFHLNIQEVAQGQFNVQKVNLAFVFQVNCPGCFIYGIPIVNKLYKSFNHKIGIIGVATAFEDFEFNNEANLKLLLNDGTLVGETKKYYEANFGVSTYKETLDFPVAFDSVLPSNEFLESNKIELFCDAVPNFAHISEKEKEILLIKIKAYYSQSPLIAETFTSNQLQGTPSFIIFDDNHNILGSYFGHQNEETLKTKIQSLIF
jgi:hypothetical protein